MFIEYIDMAKKKTTEEFVAQAMEMHGDVDTFDKVDYQGNKVKVCITCKEHGDYWMTAYKFNVKTK